MKSPSCAGAILLSVALLVVGCGAYSGSQGREASFSPATTSALHRATPGELREIAGEMGREAAPLDDLRRALAALEELERIEGASVETTIWQATIVQYLAESTTDEADVTRWCRRGDALAERIRQLDPDRVEGHYFGAIFLGLRAQRQQVRAAMWLGDLESFGRSAVAADERYDDAGPLRFLGMLLVSAPAWPLGPGDTEEGVALLQHAVELSDYPLNRVLLAQGLIANGNEQAACRTLREAMSAPREGRWAVTGPRWRPEAERLAAQMSCSLQPSPGIASAL